MIRKLVIISKEYPTDTDPIYSFVDQVACGFADAGIEVCVIAPLSLTRVWKQSKPILPRREPRRTHNGAAFTLLRPRTISVSDGRRLGIDCTMLTHEFFRRAAWDALCGLDWKPDAIYGHFIAPAGMCAAEFGEKLQIPSFVGYGESSPARYAQYTKDTLRASLKGLNGVISVSSENARVLQAEGIVGEDVRYGVFPNAVNTERFHPIDRAAARKALEFDEKAYIVCFVGELSERKGAHVLNAALKKVPGVQSIFVGKGPREPNCEGILHMGPLPNYKVPLVLAAADVFVLPTVAEGCCNAIVEALSMGLPVISSALPFNDDILHEQNSIRVDPTDVDALAAAIETLRDDLPLRERLAEGAVRKGKELEMPKRVKGILAFMQTGR